MVLWHITALSRDPHSICNVNILDIERRLLFFVHVDVDIQPTRSAPVVLKPIFRPYYTYEISALQPQNQDADGYTWYTLTPVYLVKKLKGWRKVVTVCSHPHSLRVQST